MRNLNPKIVLILDEERVVLCVKFAVRYGVLRSLKMVVSVGDLGNVLMAVNLKKVRNLKKRGKE